MLDINEAWSSIDHAIEEMAQLQYELALSEAMGGDPDIYDRKQLKSTELFMYVDLLEELTIGATAKDNKIIEILISNIKRLTKDLRRWD